jgi:hypothetical protein
LPLFLPPPSREGLGNSSWKLKVACPLDWPPKMYRYSPCVAAQCPKRPAGFSFFGFGDDQKLASRSRTCRSSRATPDFERPP